ncbi:MAG: hypothetical protein H0U59_00860 [Gemmatimonadaceae bacterium]|nr:hypothetical protein [Gemmatimonadaceae bacterium]
MAAPKVTKQPGAPCPFCGKGKVEFASMMPLVDSSDPQHPKIVEPHNLGACAACYKKQRQTIYGKE